MPFVPVTLNRTSYTPAAYVWEGFRKVLVVPSPKSQNHAEAPGTSDKSVNCTASGGGPLVGVAEKLTAPRYLIRRTLAPGSIGVVAPRSL